MKYSIIGTGAIGGYYGAKLAKAGKEVHFLLHRDYEYVKENGLQIDSCDGSFHLDNVNAYCSTADMPKSDVVFVCLKSMNNDKLTTLLPPLLKEDGTTLVVLIQNGIGLEEDVEKMFRSDAADDALIDAELEEVNAVPRFSLAAGLAFICSAKTEPGKVNHQCYGYINIGNYSCEDQQIIDTVVSDFVEAGVNAQEVEYLEARWKKAVWNMPFNGMTVALNTQTDSLLSHPSTLKLIKEQMMEVVGAAQACGVTNIDEAFADKMIDNTIHMTPYSPSMKLDYEFHRPMEIYYLYIRPIQEAMKCGFEMPKLSMLLAELEFLSVNN